MKLKRIVLEIVFALRYEITTCIAVFPAIYLYEHLTPSIGWVVSFSWAILGFAIVAMFIEDAAQKFYKKQYRRHRA